MELDVLDKLGKKGKMKVEVVHTKEVEATIGILDRTTVAIVDLHGAKGMGLARCLPSDQFSEDIGIGIATARAVRNAADEMERVWIERSIPRKEYRRKHSKKVPNGHTT